MKLLLCASTICGSLALVASQAMAVNIDMTFDPGALPSDFGFVPSDFGSPFIDPATNVSGGVWTNNLATGELSYWDATPLSSFSISGLTHAFAEITVTAFSAEEADLEMTNLKTPDGQVRVRVLEGIMRLRTVNTGANDVSVANTDGLKHTYGWEFDPASSTAKLFFDNVQVGNPGGYALDNAGGPWMYFGDGTGGSDNHVVWDRFVIADGAYPAVPPSVPGDFDSDGDVDGADFVAWQTHFPTASGATLATGDADGDGDVDGADFVVWQTHFPFTPGPAVTTVPEPHSMIVFLLGLVGAAGARVYRKARQ